MPQAQAVPEGFIPDPPPRTGLATMGEQLAAKGQTPVLRAPGPNEPVTLGDVLDNPTEGFKRLGAALKRDLSDPSTWMSAAAMYFGPKVLPKLVPAVKSALGATVKGAATGAIKGTAAVGDMVSPDIVGMFSPRAGRAVEVAQRMRAALPAKAPVAAAPVEPVAPAASEPPAPQTPAASPSAPSKGMSPQQRLNEEALARRRAAYQASQGAPAPTVAQVRPKLTAAEAKTYIQLRQAGKTDAEAYEALAALRQLTGTLPTDAEVNASVAKRNSTGRW